MMTDPIADMLSRIRNGALAGHREVFIPYSKIKYTIAKILEKEGYLESVKISGKAPKLELKVCIRYEQNKPVIRELSRVSKPGLRIYARARDLPIRPPGLGVTIISTSQGLMTAKEARSRRLGGEIICEAF